MIRKILFVLFGIVAGLTAAASFKPTAFTYSSSLKMAASPEVVFAQVNHLKNWQAWSPWQKMDPQMKQTFEGPSEGAGAMMTWAGNSDVGSGKQTVLESKPNELLRMKLEMQEPMTAVNDVTFTFTPKDGQTEVTWTMKGENGFVAKLFSVFVDIKAMVEKEFSQGLTNLQGVVEAKK
jgi:uncharacterized protein YndB with AHSA1/START domain